MEVLNSIALPQSTEHFHLLLFIYNIVLAVLLPYLALLTGSIVLAVYADRRSPDAGGMRLLARRLVSAILPSRAFFTFLAVVPALAIVFIYAQVLQTTPALATGCAALAVLFLIAAGIAGFAYQYTFRLSEAFGAGRSSGDEAAALQAGAETTHVKSGMVAAWTIVLASFFLSAATAIGIRPDAWSGITSMPAVLIAPDVWITWLMFLSLAAAMTGAGLLFFHHRGAAADGADAAYAGSLRSLAMILLTAGVLVMPVFLAGGLLRLQDLAVSGWVYALAACAVLALFAALQALYAYVQLDRPATTAYAFALVIAATTCVATMEQVTLHNATRDHAVRLASVYDRNEDALKTALGVGAKPLTGEDIYNGKCSACHLFDQKKVGPAYKNVVTKYAGRKADLVRFILNPVKVDPAFPNMPSQGLRPSEADSIATFIMKKVGVKS
jgi:cytochrome c